MIPWSRCQVSRHRSHDFGYGLDLSLGSPAFPRPSIGIWFYTSIEVNVASKDLPSWEFLGFQDLIVAALGCVFFSASSPNTAGLKFWEDPKGVEWKWQRWTESWEDEVLVYRLRWYPPGNETGKETHLLNCLWMGYVRSREGKSYSNNKPHVYEGYISTVWICHCTWPFQITGVIILPTQTIHCYKGNPSKLP